MEYYVNLPTFEGPFALLFHLIEKAEVDIYDIPVAEITAQYLETLQLMQKLNLEVASEFLVMAATLLKIKSKKLLPSSIGDEALDDEDSMDIETQEELIQRLLEYRHFRAVAQELRAYETAQKRVFVRSLTGEKVVLVNPEDDFVISGVSLPALMQAFQRLLAEHERQPLEVEADDFSVEELMVQLVSQLQGQKDGLSFSGLFTETAGLSEIILTFVALLELVRLGKLSVWQSNPFGELVVLLK
ncbi:MAG TPA: segregation/condensation protein A [Oscillospiraceae bacterium]|nr:segregation/condensation protein A [Oscillospiraceae bacterium]